MCPSFPKLYSLYYSKVILALELIAYFISLLWRNYYYVFSDCSCCQGDCHACKEQLIFLKIPHLQTLPTPSTFKQKEHSGEKYLCTISIPVYAWRFNHTDRMLCTIFTKGALPMQLGKGRARSRESHQNNFRLFKIVFILSNTLCFYNTFLVFICN